MSDALAESSMIGHGSSGRSPWGAVRGMNIVGVHMGQKICLGASIVRLTSLPASHREMCGSTRAHKSRRQDDTRRRELKEASHLWGWVHSQATH